MRPVSYLVPKGGSFFYDKRTNMELKMITNTIQRFNVDSGTRLKISVEVQTKNSYTKHELETSQPNALYKELKAIPGVCKVSVRIL